MSPLLLDTCALIFFATSEDETGEARAAVQQTHETGQAVVVSPISAWEIGVLVARGRLNLLMPPLRWFEQVMERSGLSLAALTPDVLVASSFLPGFPHRDPADRIIAATAREYGYRLITRDRSLLAYAREGHIQAIAC
ncbi:type II toxin-antitoxin system VapC family toxin [Rhodopseudomonas sp. HC1]|uniref:type II toxin-antitoxin system VapC family toxin n=1 Tax=Rhodopseudomonas infernalis TaxID=2897386 RepID=UPI001EE90189|nr:type II toxin-antitoxin system VapC family toxin [Rhodopseudomonas infernalis]MCG6204072.1 type II toxin-antitoxin system VapC family toxin [Rhodopseudomonas infernalis]